jgi:hypothetical protein
MISAVEALKEAYTPGNRAIKILARLRKIDVIELACKFLAMPLLKNSRHELFAQLIASGTCSAAEAYRRAVLDGDGTAVAGNTKLGTVRDSYADE